jgi:hypothetical protein
MPLIANASLIIESVTCNGNGLLRCALPGQNSNGTTFNATTKVGAGDEFDINNLSEDTLFSINVDESSFTIRNASEFMLDLSGFGSLGLTDFSWLGVTGNIVGVTLFTSGVSNSTQPNNDGTSLDLDDITSTTDSVVWNMAHTNWAVNSFATFTLETTQSVSAPAALSLLLLGLLGFGLTGRRRHFA